jgi:hypothetical protein
MSDPGHPGKSALADPEAHHTCPAETPVKADDKWLKWLRDIVFAACAPSPPPSQRISQTSIKYAITIN